MRFYDREKEINILRQNKLQAERSAMFTVLTGRRRVGKTALITHAMEHEGRWATFSCTHRLVFVSCARRFRQDIRIYSSTTSSKASSSTAGAFLSSSPADRISFS